MKLAAAVIAPLAFAIITVNAWGLARVHNESMSPALGNGDIVLFDRWSSPARGDVVLFPDSGGWSAHAGATLVKRVIGLEGDVIVCCEVGTGRLLLNDAPLDELYITGERPGGTVPFRIVVGEGSVWVMGDNRADSIDSRSASSAPDHGDVPLNEIRGVVRAVW